MDVETRKRLHWVMYGLYYPAVLGTAVVVTLQHTTAGLVHGPVLPIAITAATFFSLSFASAMGFEKEYVGGAFALDFVEILGMFACFAFLGLVDFPEKGHLPSWLLPSARGAYIVLFGIVLSQLWWRNVMGLRATSFLDLKIFFGALLGTGIACGGRYPAADCVITAFFALTAWLYVSHNPYQIDHPARRWFFRPERPADSARPAAHS